MREQRARDGASEKAYRTARRDGHMLDRVRDGSTAAVLAALPATWTVLPRVRWVGAQGTGDVDVALGPTGVFVIGVSTYDEAADLAAAHAATRAVAAAAPSLDARAFEPVLCFTGGGRADHDGATAGSGGLVGQVAGVTVCTATALVPALTERPTVLSQEWLDFLCFDLDMSTRRGDELGDLAADGEAGPSTPRRRPVRRARRRDAQLVGGALAVVLALASWFTVDHARQAPVAARPGIHAAR